MNTLAWCWVRKPCSRLTSWADGSNPFMTAAWKGHGVRLSRPAAWSMSSATGSVVATGAPGKLAFRALSAWFQGCSELSNVVASVWKWAARAGSRAARSLAIAAATLGMVVGLYQRWGLAVPAGSPSRVCTSMTLRLELGDADSIV